MTEDEVERLSREAAFREDRIIAAGEAVVLADEDMEQWVADETATRLRPHHLKQAHARLGDIRRDMRGVAGIAAEFGPDLRRIVVNSIEPLMWKIETAIREEKA